MGSELAEEPKNPKDAVLRPKCYGKRKTSMSKCYECKLIEDCSKDTLSIFLNNKPPVHIVGP